MAGLALTVVGTAIGGPFGGLAGGLIGSYLDQAFIYPALFGRPSGPRMEDLTVQTASEGAYGRNILGPQNRTAGTLIWAADYIPHENQSGKKGPTYYTYTGRAAIRVCDGKEDGSGIRGIKRIWADTKIIYDSGWKDSRVADIRIYTGTRTQTVDPLIDAYDPGNTPAYRGSCYVVIEDLMLTDWGNRLPNFSFEVISDIAMPVQTAIRKLTERAGIDSGEIDVSRVPGCLRGYVTLGPQETIQNLSPLMTAFFLGARDDDGVLTFWRRGEEDTLSVSEVDLGAREYGQDASAHLVKITDTKEFQLPSSVSVQHFDPAWDLQQGSQTVRRVNATTINSASVTLPITLSVDEAKDIAKRLLWGGYAERQIVEFDLPPSYFRVQEGDVLNVPITATTTAQVRVTQIARGFNYLMKVTGQITELQTYDQSSSVDTRTGTATITEPTALTWRILDIPAITSNHTNILGFYVVAAFRNTATSWRGSQGYKSSDGGVTFTEAWTNQREACIGEATSILGNSNASPYFWDNENTVTVKVFEGTLITDTEDNVLNGANRAMLGDEIIGFRTATLVGTRTYTLSGLLRGLRDTQDFIAGHGVGEAFTLLSTGTAAFYTGIENSDVGVSRVYRNVPAGAVATDAPTTTQAPIGGTLRHFTPANLVAKKSPTSNDCNVTWNRRSRALTPPFASGGAPLMDSDETYIVEICSAFDTPVRTETLLNPATTTFVYTDAMQTADGFTAGTSHFFVRVYQVSSVAGRSRAASLYYDATT